MWPIKNFLNKRTQTRLAICSELSLFFLQGNFPLKLAMAPYQHCQAHIDTQSEQR